MHTPLPSLSLLLIVSYVLSFSSFFPSHGRTCYTNGSGSVKFKAHLNVCLIFFQQTSRIILSRQVFEHDIVDVSVELFYIYIGAIRWPKRSA